MKTTKEKRTNSGNEITVNQENRTISGYAIVFDKESVDLGGFREIVEPSALKGVIEVSNIKMPIDHNTSRGILARCVNGEGSLKLEVDEIGLRYSTEVPKTALGDEALETAHRGDFGGSSFEFSLPTDGTGTIWEKKGDYYLRRIKRFEQLFDVSPVYDPAYKDTTVAARSFERRKQEDAPPQENFHKTNNLNFLL